MIASAPASVALRIANSTPSFNLGSPSPEIISNQGSYLGKPETQLLVYRTLLLEWSYQNVGSRTAGLEMQTDRRDFTCACPQPRCGYLSFPRDFTCAETQA